MTQLCNSENNTGIVEFCDTMKGYLDKIGKLLCEEQRTEEDIGKKVYKIYAEYRSTDLVQDPTLFNRKLDGIRYPYTHNGASEPRISLDSIYKMSSLCSKDDFLASFPHLSIPEELVTDDWHGWTLCQKFWCLSGRDKMESFERFQRSLDVFFLARGSKLNHMSFLNSRGDLKEDVVFLKHFAVYFDTPVLLFATCYKKPIRIEPTKGRATRRAAISILLDVTEKKYYPLMCTSVPARKTWLILDSNVLRDPKIWKYIRAPIPNISIYIPRSVLSQEFALQMNDFNARESRRLIEKNSLITIQNPYWEKRMTVKYGPMPENRIIDEKIQRTARYMAGHYTECRVIILTGDRIMQIEARNEKYQVLSLEEYEEEKAREERKRKGDDPDDEPPAKKPRTGQ